MKSQKLGEIEVSGIVQGFWRLVDWNLSTKELVEFVGECLDLGVTTFDSAEIYSDTECETQIGNLFLKDSSLRKRMQIVSKMGIYKTEAPNGQFGYYDTTYERIIRSCKDSLKRLNTEYLDIYLIHREDPCIDPWESARALEDLKRDGLIREFGVSNFDPHKYNALNTATKNALVTNQIEVNPFCFEHFDSGMIDFLSMKKIHPMIWSPLAGGRLFEKNDLQAKSVRERANEIAKNHGETLDTIIYAWLAHHPVGMIPISGSKKTDRLKNAIRGMGVELEHWEWYYIYTASGQNTLR